MNAGDATMLWGKRTCGRLGNATAKVLKNSKISKNIYNHTSAYIKGTSRHVTHQF